MTEWIWCRQREIMMAAFGLSGLFRDNPPGGC
jgi:hypothetical protein